MDAESAEPPRCPRITLSTTLVHSRGLHNLPQPVLTDEALKHLPTITAVLPSPVAIRWAYLAAVLSFTRITPQEILSANLHLTSNWLMK